MRKKGLVFCLFLIVMSGVFEKNAQAGIPVIDAATLAQQISSELATVASWASQYGQMVSQLKSLEQQFEQLQQTYNSIQGVRNMGSLVTNPSAMQYLPNDYAKIITDGYGVYKDIMSLNSRLTLSTSSIDPKSQTGQDYQASAKKAATNMAAFQDAYSKAGGRVTDIQALLDKVNNSPDEKDIEDLQAAIQVESAMIQNEMTKLLSLAQLSQAQKDLQAQQDRDICIAKYNNKTIPDGW